MIGICIDCLKFDIATASLQLGDQLVMVEEGECESSNHQWPASGHPPDNAVDRSIHHYERHNLDMVRRSLGLEEGKS